MNLVQRAQSILLRPKETWPTIAAERTDAATLYTSYIAPLAAIPAIARFVGLSLIGIGGFGVSFRVPILTGLVNLVVGYVLSLVVVYGLALIVDALAPTFGGTRSRIEALKVVAYASTAGFVGGIFSLIPSLSILSLLASLYGIYLLYTGLPALMRCPREKAAGYTAVVIVCAIVAFVVIGTILSALSPMGMEGRGVAMGGPSVTVHTPQGEVSVDSSKMAAMAQKMEEASKRMEAAQKSGDSAAAGKAMGDVMAAMTGTNATPIAASDLKALLPDSLGDLKRSAVESQSGQAMGIGGSSAKATYGDGSRRVELAITDLGGAGGLAAMAAWANMTVDRETDTQVEKVYKDGARTVREEWQKDGSRGKLTTILGNGVVVEADGSGVDMPALKRVVASVDVGKIEALKRAAKP